MKYIIGSLLLFFAMGAQAERTDIRLVAQAGDHYFFTVSRPFILDRNYVSKSSENFCFNRSVCRVYWWETGASVPRRFPMTDRQIESQVAQYEQNKATRHKRMLWSCHLFPDVPKSDCF